MVMICIFEPFYPSLRKKMPPLPAFWKGLSRAVNGSLAFTLAQIQCQAPAAHHLQGSESGVGYGHTADPTRALSAQPGPQGARPLCALRPCLPGMPRLSLDACSAPLLPVCRIQFFLLYFS